MIVGIGTDIVEIARINKLLIKYNKKFINKILSATEASKKNHWSATDLAKKFSAKEAIVKALGTGFANGITMPQIVILHDKNGKPLVKLTGKAKQQLLRLQANNIQISISDEKNNAIAFCIIENTP